MLSGSWSPSLFCGIPEEPDSDEVLVAGFEEEPDELEPPQPETTSAAIMDARMARRRIETCLTVMVLAFQS